MFTEGAAKSSNPTNEKSSHVYEYIPNEDQVRQLRMESPYVEPFDFAIQGNPAYGASVQFFSWRRNNVFATRVCTSTSLDDKHPLN